MKYYAKLLEQSATNDAINSLILLQQDNARVLSFKVSVDAEEQHGNEIMSLLLCLVPSDYLFPIVKKKDIHGRHFRSYEVKAAVEERVTTKGLETAQLYRLFSFGSLFTNPIIIYQYNQTARLYEIQVMVIYSRTILVAVTSECCWWRVICDFCDIGKQSGPRYDADQGLYCVL